MLISRISIHNPQFTGVVFLLLLSLGLLSYFTMPRYESPQVRVPGVNLIITYPGASPEDLEDLVVDPIEEAVYEIDNLTKMTSDIRDGFATIRIEFALTEDKVEKNNEVQQKISRVQSRLPEGVNIRSVEFSVSNVQIVQLAFLSKTAGYERMQTLAEDLEEEIERLGGVKEVDLEGTVEKRLVIDLDFQKLARYELSASQVADIIRANNRNIPAGSVRLGQQALNLQSTHAYRSLEEIKFTILKSVQNQPVYVRDVAEVYFRYQDPEYIARAFGQKAVFVSIYPKENANALPTIEAVKAMVAKFRTQLPGDITLKTVFDQSVSINNKVDLLFGNLWQGILIVGFFILLFFDLRASFLVMVAIPLSFLLGLILADVSDFGLQFMSIAGLIIALGLLVDNAIVVVENVYQFIKEGYSRTEAALRAIEQVGWSITSSTITTVLAFVPLLNIKSLPGEYLKSMPLTLIYTLIASLLVALTFTPFLSSRLLQPANKQRESWVQLGIAYFIRTTYRVMVVWVLSHRWLTINLAFLALALSAALIPVIGLSFFPRDDAPVFAINITAPQGTVLEETDRAVRFVEALLDQQPGIDYYLSNTGYGNPRVINVIRRTEKQTFAAQVMVFLKDVPFQERDQMIETLRQSFATYSQADIELKEALLGPPLDAQISIKLYGNDLREVKKWAGQVEQVIRRTPGTVNIYNPLKKFKNKLQLEVDELAAANLAVPLAEIAQNVRIAVSGTSVSEFRDGQRQLYDLYVQMQRPDNFVRPSDVSQIYVPARTGQMVPLSQLARLEFGYGPEKINHDLKRRTFAVNADVAAGINVDETTKKIIDELKKLPFPPGYGFEVGGELESRTEAFGDLFQSLLIALLGVFSVLVLQFRSFLQPFIIFTSIPLSFIGAIWGLFLSGYSFSFTAYIGAIGLVGIVVNDAIILIDLINQYLKEGTEKSEAIAKAAEHRFIPIMLTSLTTIGGMLPLTLRGGLFWAPMGWCIIGGLTTSTLLTLLVVPALSHIFTRGGQAPKKIAI